MAAPEINKIEALKDTVEAYPWIYEWEHGSRLNHKDLKEYTNFLNNLKSAKTSTEIAAVLLSLNVTISSDADTQDNFKTYLLNKLSHAEEVYYSDREVAYTKKVADITQVNLPALPIRVEKNLNKLFHEVLTRADLDESDEKYFVEVLEEIKAAKKLTQETLALLVVYASNTDAIEIIHEEIVENDKFSFSDLLKKMPAIGEPILSVNSPATSPNGKVSMPLARFRSPPRDRFQGLDLQLSETDSDSEFLTSPSSSSDSLIEDGYIFSRPSSLSPKPEPENNKANNSLRIEGLDLARPQPPKGKFAVPH